jgi:Fe-S cluster assembly protein SufD
MTMQATIEKDAYLTHLLEILPVLPTDFSWLSEVRDRATAIVRQSKFPTTRDEEWRFTNLSALRQLQFNQVETHVTPLPDVAIPEAEIRLVFVNGVYAPTLSAETTLEGVIVGNLSSLPPHLRSHLAQVEGAEEVFTALNTARMTDAAVIWVAANVSVESPIQVVFLTTDTISQPRCLVIAESGSQLTLVEEYRSLSSSGYFTNAVTEIWLSENAHVNHNRIEREGVNAIHIGKTATFQARHSQYTCNAIAFGGKISRHNLEVYQTGEQTETTLNGLTMIAQEQLADTHSLISLKYPHGTTRQLHKCIVGDRAHAVFNGKVYVPKMAQLTDAGQLNRNLLLSPKARVDTKPQLEITADNVKCSHGATVSQLEDDEIFYLQSRGLDKDNARHLLINAFAIEIINQIPLTSLRQTLSEAVSQY